MNHTDKMFLLELPMLTRRDAFALVGFYAFMRDVRHQAPPVMPEQAAKVIVKYADAVIAQLDKPKEEPKP